MTDQSQPAQPVPAPSPAPGLAAQLWTVLAPYVGKSFIALLGALLGVAGSFYSQGGGARPAAPKVVSVPTQPIVNLSPVLQQLTTIEGQVGLILEEARAERTERAKAAAQRPRPAIAKKAEPAGLFTLLKP